MKKIINITILLLGIVLISGCSREILTRAPSTGSLSIEQKSQNGVTFKEPGIESQFTLPSGWSYEKLKGTLDVSAVNYIDSHVLPNTVGLSQFVFYDKNHTAIGGVSFIESGSQAERSFDGCNRAYDIESAENKKALKPDNFSVLANDKKTKIVAETCGMGSFIYWVPGDAHPEKSYNTVSKSARLIFLQNADRGDVSGLHMNDDQFVQLVHDIENSITLK